MQTFIISFGPGYPDCLRNFEAETLTEASIEAHRRSQRMGYVTPEDLEDTWAQPWTAELADRLDLWPWVPTPIWQEKYQ